MAQERGAVPGLREGVMDFPQDMTPRQRTAKLVEWLKDGARLPVQEAAQRLGVRRRSVYRIVYGIGTVCPGVRIEDGEVFYEEL